MSKNRIGIEVQVEFPSIKEMQNKLSQKLSDKLKVNVQLGVDRSSISRLKKKVQDALDTKNFNVKLNVGNVNKGLNNIQKKINKLDGELKKKRQLKVDFKVGDLDKTFKEVLKSAEKTEKEFKNQGDAVKQTNRELDKQVAKVEKMVTASKQLKDGTYATTYKTTGRDLNGDRMTVTENPDGRVDYTREDNRKKALQEIEAIMKRIHSLELDRMSADKESTKIINKQLSQEKEVLDSLKSQYSQKYKTMALSEKSTKELQRVQEMTKALKEQALYAKEERKEKQKIESSISRVAQLEQKKQQLALKILQASEAEVLSLRQQYDHLDKIQGELKQKYNLQEKMTNAQKEELDNIRRIGFLERQRATAIKQAREEADKLSRAEREQKAINDSIMSDLRKIHQLRQDIYKLESKRTPTDDDRIKLTLLREQQQVAKQAMETAMKHYQREGLVTQELKQQMQAQRDINQTEMKRIQRASQLQNEQEQTNAKLKKYMDLTRQIGQLQRDLIYSGMRERNVIEDKVNQLESQRSQLRDNLRQQNLLTDAVEREVKAIERAQREQRVLNRERQKARERDQAFNDTGGLIDPYSFMANVEQGAMHILEPIARLDEALIGVMKVADATEEQFREFAESSYDVGSSLGVSADEYVLAVEKWVTAGKTFKESQDLANISLVGSFVGNISPDDMVKYMAVPLNAFKKDMLEAEDVINSMNEVSNNHAIEMNDLGKAYVRSATTAKDAGISFGELTGMIAGAQEATRKGGERIGTGLKTIAMNMGNINAQMTKGEQRKFAFFESIGVDFQNAEGKMLTGTEILQNLVNVYDELSTEDKTTAKFYLAGKEHAEILGAVVDQWDRVKTVNDEVGAQLGEGKEGSAYLEHAKQADSVKFKLAELKNTWDKFMWTIAGGKDGVSDVLGTITEGLEALTDLASNESLMKAIKYIFAGMALHAGANLYKRFFDTFMTGIGRMKRGMNETRGLMKEMRTGQSLAMGGVGATSVIARTGIGNRGGNGSNGGNGGNGTHANGTRIVPLVGGVGGVGNRSRQEEQEARRRQQLRDREDRADEERAGRAERRADRVNVRMSATAKTFTKFLGALPLLGDALLILDIMGVPVFEKIGGWLDGLTTSAKELNAELETSNKKFMATNNIVNGGAIKKDNELEGTKNSKGDRSGGIVQEFEKGLKSDGYLSEEEFLKLQERFKTLAEEANIDVRIEMNDTAHINDAIEKLRQGLTGLKEDGIKDLGNKYLEQIENIKTANSSIAEGQANLGWLEEQKKAQDEIISKYKERLESGQELSDSERTFAERSLKDAQVWSQYYGEQIKETKNNLSEQEAIIKKAGGNIETYSEKLREYIASGGKLTGMTREQTVTAVEPMINTYNKLTKQINGSKKATAELNGANKISKANWDKLVATYPALKSISIDEVNKNKEKRKAVQEVVKAEQKKKKEQQESTKKAIDGLSKQGKFENDIKVKIGETTSATGKLKDEISKKNKEIDNTKKEVKTTWVFKLKETVKGLWNALTKGFSNSTSTHTVKVNEEKGKSISIGGASDSQASTSKSVSIGKDLLTSSTSVDSLAKSSSNSKASSKKTVNNSRVSGDVSRYWSREMYGIEKTDNILKDLTRAINDAKDNQTKIIKIYQQQQQQLKKQASNYRGLYSAKDGEMNSTLNKLKKFGFRVDTKSNKVLNLSHASKLKGKKAEDAESLLNTWKSLYSEMSGIQENIKSIGSQIKDINDNIKNAKIAKELKQYESTIKRIDALLKSINNADTLTDKRLGFIGESDTELSLLENEKALNSSKKNMSKLISEFNKLSTKKISFEENGKTLQSSLEGLGSEILKQSDAIIKYQQAINDIEIGRVIDDLGEFNKTIDDNTAKIKNNVDNLKEGLVSGTKLKDLQSSKASIGDFKRDNQYEKLAKQRIALEKDVQQALDGFAKKNVERVKGVSKATLTITASTYNQMLKMASNYTAKKKNSAKAIKTQYKDLVSIGNIDEDYKLVVKLDKALDALSDKQTALAKKYDADIAKAKTSSAKDTITNKYILDSLKLQEQYYKATIDGNKMAISELNKKLKDPSLTDEQENKIKQQVSTYEKEIVDAQNSIKDSIKERFDFEFKLLDDAVKEYDKFSSELDYAMDIINSLGGENSASKDVLLREMMKVEKSRNSKLASTTQSLQKQLSLYKEGSYEWKIINDELEEYKKSLKDSNLELLEMNKNIMSNSFTGTMQKIERSMFDGKTLEDFKAYQDLWMDGLEREIALEDVYKRMADLGTSMYNQKVDLLEKQEKLSKYEMDYLNKQLDVLELQQKLENLNKEKTVQTLKQSEDGTWDWVYSADPEQISQVQDELAQKQLELQELEQKGREDYLSKLDKILDKAENGDFENVKDFQDAIADLGNAFESIVGDFPQIKDEYIKELINSYSKYIKENGVIVKGANIESNIKSPIYAGFSKEVVKAFDSIGENMANAFANTLIKKIPNIGVSSSQSKETGKSISINLERIEFPNIKSSEGIKEAILSLPQIALQASKEKR